MRSPRPWDGLLEKGSKNMLLAEPRELRHERNDVAAYLQDER